MLYLLGDTILSIHELALVTALPSRGRQRTKGLARIVASDLNPFTGKPRTILARGIDPYHAASALGLIYLPLDDVAINPLIGPRFSPPDPSLDPPTHPATVAWGLPPRRYPLITPVPVIHDIMHTQPPIIVTAFDLTPSGHLIERPIHAAYFLKAPHR